MYSRFYGFTTEPFQNTPDLDFLFLSPNHKEALACLEYGIQQRKGFIAVTGEAGVGKTIILRSYLTKVDAQKQKTIYVLNPKLTFDSLLTTILKELSAEPVAGIAAQKLNQLHEVLIAEYRNDHTVVLIIDEAQHIPIETLESIRMLSNMETATEKLIQIVLVGQPELDALLNRSELRHVRERIALRARIAPLTKTESEEYIDHRLNLVSREPRSVFSKQALDRRDFAAAAGGFQAILLEEPGFLDAPQLLVQANAGLRATANGLFESGKRGVQEERACTGRVPLSQRHAVRCSRGPPPGKTGALGARGVLA